MANIKSLAKEIWKGRYGYLFIAPGYLAFAVFMLVPLLFAISLSFYKASFNLDARTFVGFEQFIRLSKDHDFIDAFVNTLKYVGVVVPATVVVSLVVALLVHPLGRKAQAFYRGAFYLPGVAGGVIMSIVWLWIFNPTIGLLNYLLGLVNIEPILWLGSMRYSFWSVCIVVLTFTVGQPIILFLAGLAGMSQDVMDAATVDGANGPQRTWYVTLPMLRPGVEATLVAIRGGGRLRGRLADMGLVPGVRVRLLTNSDWGRVVVASGETRLALGRGMAQKIMVR